MESLPGIVDLKMSGTVGTFSLEAGKTLDEATVKKAVEANSLTFAGMEVEARGVAAAVWKLDVEGPT